MAERKTDEQKLVELEKKLEQIKAQKKALENKTKDKERKARTRRLIELGAISEKYFNCANIAPADYEKLLKSIVSMEQVKTAMQPYHSVDNSEKEE